MSPVLEAAPGDAVLAALEGSPARDVMVRFSHVDAAAIVFFPRFVEMCAQAFPELLPPELRGNLAMTFGKPIMLGDRLSLVLDSASSGERWRLSGQVNANEHLSVAWQARPAPVLKGAAHEPDRPAFVSDVIEVQAWCVGATARLQLSRYYEFVNTAIEQWFAQELDRPFRQLHDNREGIPTVSIETACGDLPQLGESVRIWIRSRRIGRRSLTFESCLVRDETCLIKTQQTIVFVKFSPAGASSIEIPDSVRSRLQQRLPERPAE